MKLKKILLALFVCTLLLSAIGITAFAADTHDVASYEELVAALDKAVDGDTINMTANIDAGSNIITINKSITLTGKKQIHSSASRIINIDTVNATAEAPLEVSFGDDIKLYGDKTKTERGVNIIDSSYQGKPAKITISKIQIYDVKTYGIQIASSVSDSTLTLWSPIVQSWIALNVNGDNNTVNLNYPKFTGTAYSDTDEGNTVTISGTNNKVIAKFNKKNEHYIKGVEQGAVLVIDPSSSFTVAEGEADVSHYVEGEIYYAVAKPASGEGCFLSLQDAVDSTKAGGAVTILRPMVIEEDTTIDLKGITFTAIEGVYPAIRVQKGATLTISNGTIINPTDYVFVVGSSDLTESGALVINGGTYEGLTTVASVSKGTLTINDGNFEAYDGGYGSTYLLNCYDASRKDGTASITVNGGTFADFNPADNKAEGAGTSFVSEGYEAVDNGNGTYSVQEAEVKDVTIVKLSDTKYAFVSTVDSLDYSAVGFDITIGEKTNTFKTNTVYDKVVVNGSETKTIDGAPYVYAVVVDFDGASTDGMKATPITVD